MLVRWRRGGYSWALTIKDLGGVVTKGSINSLWVKGGVHGREEADTGCLRAAVGVS